MPANAQNTYSDYYQSSAYGSYVAESRIVGTPPVSLVHVKQPPGAFPDPALPFIALGLFRHCNTKLTGDMGAGRFQGRVTHGSIVVTALDTATDLVVDGPHSILITALPAVRVHRLFSQESWATMDFGILHAKVFRDDLVERLCIRLWNRVRQDEQSSLLVDAAVMTMVSCLMEHRGTKHAPFPTSKNNTSSQWRIKRAVDYLRANLEEDGRPVNARRGGRIESVSFRPAVQARHGSPSAISI